MATLSSLSKGPTEARLKVKRIIEALLFASSEAVTLNKMLEITAEIHPFKPRELLEITHELQIEYDAQERAFELVETAEGFALRTRKTYAPYVERLFGGRQTERLSPAAAEALAIIAYRGPITRPQIEALRGVDSSGVVQSLQERNLIEPVGKLDAPGKPTLYAVTLAFLTHFGFKSLEDFREKNGSR